MSCWFFERVFEGWGKQIPFRTRNEAPEVSGWRRLGQEREWAGWDGFRGHQERPKERQGVPHGIRWATKYVIPRVMGSSTGHFSFLGREYRSFSYGWLLVMGFYLISDDERRRCVMIMNTFMAKAEEEGEGGQRGPYDAE